MPVDLAIIAPIRQPIASQQGFASREWVRYFNNAIPQFVTVDTTTAPVTIDLAKYAGNLIIKDIAGHAAANPITILGTIEGVMNPAIMTNYGVVRLFGATISGVRVWVTW